METHSIYINHTYLRFDSVSFLRRYDWLFSPQPLKAKNKDSLYLGSYRIILTIL